MLRQPLLLLARSGRVKDVVTRMPVTRHMVDRYVPGEATPTRSRRRARSSSRGLRVDARLPRRGHHRPRAGRRDVAAYLELLRQLAAQGLARARRGVGQAVGGRAGAARRRRADRPRERPPDLRRGPQRRHHGDPRHGGPHDHRLDPARARRAARGLPRDRRGAPGLPAPHRGRLPRPGDRRARGCGCARAPTTSPSRSPSSRGSRSTSPTSAA